MACRTSPSPSGATPRPAWAAVPRRYPGGAIGWERHWAGTPAGLRTNILICVGAALITGLTSAATLWVVVAIGMAVGFNASIEATGTTALVLVVLIPLRRVEARAEVRRLRRGGTPEDPGGEPEA